MKCEKCNNNFSDNVLSIHLERCNSDVSNLIEIEKKVEKRIDALNSRVSLLKSEIYSLENQLNVIANNQIKKIEVVEEKTNEVVTIEESESETAIEKDETTETLSKNKKKKNVNNN